MVPRYTRMGELTTALGYFKFLRETKKYYLPDNTSTTSLWSLVSILDQATFLWMKLSLQSWASAVAVIKYKMHKDQCGPGNDSRV